MKETLLINVIEVHNKSKKNEEKAWKNRWRTYYRITRSLSIEQKETFNIVENLYLERLETQGKRDGA